MLAQPWTGELEVATAVKVGAWWVFGSVPVVMVVGAVSAAATTTSWEPGGTLGDTKSSVEVAGGGFAASGVGQRANPVPMEVFASCAHTWAAFVGDRERGGDRRSWARGRGEVAEITELRPTSASFVMGLEGTNTRQCRLDWDRKLAWF